MSSAETTIVRGDDPLWDELVRGRILDPHCLRAFAVAHAGDGAEAALVFSQGDGWSCAEVVLLQRLGGSRSLVRPPLYGGPWLDVTAGMDAAVAAGVARRASDDALRGVGAVSHVSVLSPWLCQPAAVRLAWNTLPGKPICLARLDDMEARWHALGSTRRAEVRRVDREGSVRWAPFDLAAAARFAGLYGDAMQALDAPARWRLGAEYFERLAARATGHLNLAAAETPQGGAAALCLDDGVHAAYLYAARWGNAPGVSSAALWCAQRELAGRGVRGMLLGGGVTDSPDDSLLRFKRDFADSEAPLHLVAIAFDRDAHDAAVAAGLARPLPDGAVDA